MRIKHNIDLYVTVRKRAPCCISSWKYYVFSKTNSLTSGTHIGTLIFCANIHLHASQYICDKLVTFSFDTVNILKKNSSSFNFVLYILISTCTESILYNSTNYRANYRKYTISCNNFFQVESFWVNSSVFWLSHDSSG